MIQIYRNLYKDDEVIYNIDCSTVLQAERWLDKNGIISENKEKGMLFQGLAYAPNSPINQLLSYKTVLNENKDIYLIWFHFSKKNVSSFFFKVGSKDRPVEPDPTDPIIPIEPIDPELSLMTEEAYETLILAAPSIAPMPTESYPEILRVENEAGEELDPASVLVFAANEELSGEAATEMTSAEEVFTNETYEEAINNWAEAIEQLGLSGETDSSFWVERYFFYMSIMEILGPTITLNLKVNSDSVYKHWLMAQFIEGKWTIFAQCEPLQEDGSLVVTLPEEAQVNSAVLMLAYYRN